MSTANRVRSSVIEFKGQKSGLPIESYGLDSGQEIKNFVLKEGALMRVQGGTQLTTINETSIADQGGILSLHRFKNLTVAQRYLGVFCENSEGAGAFTCVNNTSTGTLTLAQKLFSATWRDRIFFTNGRDNTFLLNEPSNLTDYSYGYLGLDPPNSFSAGWFFAVSAGNVANGDYYYLITGYDENTNTESPAFGALSGADGLYELSPNGAMGPRPAPFTVSGGSKIVEITYSSLGPALTAYQALYPRVTHFIVYRGTKTGSLYNSFFRVPLKNGGSMDGQVFVRISTFISEATHFKDNTATADLPTVSLAENNSPPPTPARMKAARDYVSGNIAGGSETPSHSLSDYSGFKHMRFFRDQLFGFGAHSPGIYVNEMSVGETAEKVSGTVNNFRHLLHGSEVYQPDYFPYLWEVGRGDGQDAIGMGVLGDTALLLFKQKSTYYLSGSSPSDYIVRILDTNKGAVHQSTIQETPIGVIVLDRSGFVLFDKIAQGKRISKQIQDVIDSINFDYAENFYSSFDPHDQRYYCAVVTRDAGSFNTPNVTLCLDLDTLEWTYTSFNEGLARVMDSSSDNGFVDIIGGRANGILYDSSDPTKILFDTLPIESIWTSGPTDFGDDQHKKKLRWLYLRARGNESFTINIEIIPDYDEGKKFVLEDYDSLKAFSTWYSSDAASDGNLIWDEGYWSGLTTQRRVCKIPVIVKGYSFQVRIINTDTDAARYGFGIESVSVEAEVMDK